MTAQQLVDRLRQLESESGGRLSLARFCALAQIGTSTIYRRFAGGWRQLREQAGLPRAVAFARRFSDAELLEPVIRFHQRYRRMPKWREIEKLLPASMATYQRRYGRKDAIQRAFIEHMKNELVRRGVIRDPDAPPEPRSDAPPNKISNARPPGRRIVGPYPNP